MAEQGEVRASKILKKYNIGFQTLIDFLKEKGFEMEQNPNARVPAEAISLIENAFKAEQDIKEQSKKVATKIKEITEMVKKDSPSEPEETEEETVIVRTTTIGNNTNVPDTQSKEETRHAPDFHKDKDDSAKEHEDDMRKASASGEKSKESPLKIIGKIELDEKGNVKRPQPKAETKPETETVPGTPEAAPEPAQKPVTEHPAEAKDETTAVEPQETEKPQETVQEPVAKPAQTPETGKEDVPVAVADTEKDTAGTEEGTKQGSGSLTGIKSEVERLRGPIIIDKIDLSQFEKKSDKKNKNKSKRERIHKSGANPQKVDIAKESGGTSGKGGNNDKQQRSQKQNKKKSGEKFKPVAKIEIDEDAIQKQIKETYAKMTENKGKTKGSKHRKEKRELVSQKMQQEIEKSEMESKILKVTEFVTVNDLATLMNNTPVTKVIEACMNLGLMVSINQRLDAEALVLVAEEFGYEIQFVTAEVNQAIEQEQDKEEDLVPRPPIITVMGHVDHGKTSLLDYIRKSNVIAGEAGGITQHIGAYNVELPDGRRITFLDTPGHEAFTAMRARGAKITDLAIIIIAADDAIMPQTVEAINHAQAAGVPMVFAINKIDKPGANPDKIREQLANMNILVEEWGGKYQCQEISAKKGINVDKLLDKVLLEAELLDLKANPNKKAMGTIIESSLDKGRGYLATILVQGGTLHVGDIMLSGSYTGRVKAMFNERGQKVDNAGPSTPVSVLGLNGAPTAGETFNVMDDEKEAREIANKREQLLRIQGIKTQKHITLEEIGRRIAIGNFKELNIIVKGDVDGSIEALSDSLLKLSTEEVHVEVIHKAVGQISESDVLLAAASNAIIIGFQVRPSANARRLAEKEGIEIRLYSVIYDAINEIKSGIEGMLAPVEKEEVTATAEVQEIFKISKVGTIAGCIVRDGKLTRTAKVRVIRDGIVVYTGELGSLKRFKDDVKEVAAGYDCGLNISGYNDIKIGDIIEAYTIVEVKRTL